MNQKMNGMTVEKALRMLIQMRKQFGEDKFWQMWNRSIDRLKLEGKYTPEVEAMIKDLVS